MLPVIDGCHLNKRYHLTVYLKEN